MICFCRIKYTIMSGRITSVVAANRMFHWIDRSPLKKNTVSGSVLEFLPWSRIRGYIKLFHTRRAMTIKSVTIGGFSSGRITLIKV